VQLIKKPLLAASILLMSSHLAWAKATPEEISRLGKDLTPIGAEAAGNKEGTIPPWTGGLTKPPAGFDVKKGYADPFAGEKPLFTITGANADEHKEKLTVGQIAMLKKYPTFKINVYKTHRTAAYPERVYEDVKKYAATADLSADGVVGTGTSTVPFPFPKKGQEVLWNHSLRWRGGGTVRDYNWHTVNSNGASYKVAFREEWLYESLGFLDTKRDNAAFVIKGTWTEPATLVGTIYLAWDNLDMSKQARQGWIYNAGQRRVRRAPELCCDFIAEGTDGLRFTDQHDAWNGTTERYDWKLVGKKEMYIPYNVYKLTDKSLKASTVLQKGHIDPELMRYELHRVWIVEGTLKSGARHVIAKRTMYIDEDTWQVAAADLYDARGQLWRYQDGSMAQFYDAQVPWYSAYTIHDLISGSYILNQTSFDTNTTWKFGVKGKLSDFEPDELRRQGTK